MKILEPFGPKYPDLGARVAKFRRIPKNQLTEDHKREYGEAIESAIRSLQRSEFFRHHCFNPISPLPHCASGTWYSEGDDIHKAIREQQKRALWNYPEQVRKKRTQVEWQELYNKAMAEKQPRATVC
jgi:alpha-amylase/alpha-mannosidase (GH57 family)